MDPVNSTTLALVLGISTASVSRLNVKGVLPRAGKGMFDLPACAQTYLKLRLVQAQSGEVTAQSLTAERSRLARLKADAAERNAKVESGELVPADTIEAAWLAVASAVRARLLLIPTKTAPRIVTMKTPAEARALLQREIHAALAALSATPVA
jgi:phage terminase Nu1 subunit (DNA packaging protein)